MHGTRHEPDARDDALRAERQDYLLGRTMPDVGDFVIYPDGTERRIAHVWDFGPDDKLSGYQTASPRSSYYVGKDHVSYSGSLFGSQPWNSLQPTDERRFGTGWFFHHDFATAHNGIDFLFSFRVWRSTVAPTT